MTRLFKYYVDVVTMIGHDGTLMPMALIWKGQRFSVEKVVSVREMFSRAGGSGICYTCRFGGKDRHLFWERNRWFLETELYAPEMEEQNLDISRRTAG